ncbi:MAG TPA: hypothetical protein VGG56_01010 [Terracidiphilus sp.]
MPRPIRPSASARKGAPAQELELDVEELGPEELGEEELDAAADAAAVVDAGAAVSVLPPEAFVSAEADSDAGSLLLAA